MLYKSFLINLRKSQLEERDGLYQLERRIEATVERGLDRLNAEIKPALVGAPPDPGTSDLQTEDTTWQRRLDEGKKLAEQQKWAAALQVFRQIESEAGEQGLVGPRLWYRLNLNIGSSFLSLGRMEEARPYFVRALDCEPEDSLALSQLAQVEMRLGNTVSAREFANRTIAAQPLSDVGWSVRIQTAEHELVPEEIPEELRENPTILLARGMVAFQRDRREEGLALFRRALRNGSRDAQVLVILAESLMMEAVAENPFGEFSAELRQEVVRLSTDAVETLEAMERDDLLARALVARGVASLGINDQAARVDLNRASELAPDALPPRFHMARVLLEQGRADSALFLLDHVAAGSNVALVESLRARALLMLGRTTDVESALRAGLEGHAGTEDLDTILIDLADTAIEAGLLDLAEEMLTSVDPDQAGFHLPVLRGRMEAARNEHDVAQRFYDEALRRAPEEQRQAVAVEYAWQLLRIGKAREARQLFEVADAAEMSDPVRRAYAQSLIGSGAYERAAELLSRVHAEGEPADWALDMGAMIALHRDDLPGAIDNLGELLSRRPDDTETRIRLVWVLQRSGDWERSLEVLSPLRDREDLDGHDLARVAQLYAFADRSMDALALVYRAVRRSPADPEIKRVYMKFFMEREADSDDFDVTEVGPDTWVRLEEVGGSRTREYFIVSDQPHTGHPTEIAAADAIALRLEGKHVGHVITFHVGQLSEATYRVAEIKSGYVHMFQHIMAVFPVQHPEFEKIQAFHIDETKLLDSFTPIFASLERKAAQAEQVLEYYSSKGLPLGFVATMGGISLRGAYDTLAQHATRFLHVERGDPNSRARSRWAVRQDTPVLLTISGLVTLHRLGRLDLLIKLQRELVAPQSLLDELADEIRELEVARRRGGTKTMAKDGERYRFIESRAESVQMNIDEVAAIRDFVVANARMLPRPFAALGNEVEQVREGIGASSYDAYALSGPDRMLFADDVGLRGLAASEKGAPGFPTAALLEEANAQGLLSREEFHRDLSRLIEANHGFISLSADGLYDILVDTGYALNARVLKVLDRLSPEHANQETAIPVAAGMLRQLALSPLGKGVMESVAVVLFERLARGRSAHDAMRFLDSALKPAFSLLPLEYGRLRERMDTFLKSRTGRGLTDE